MTRFTLPTTLRRLALLTTTLLTFPLAASAAPIATVTDGPWSDPNTWSTLSTPSPSDDVTIGHNVTLASSTGALNSLVMNAGSLTATGWNTKIEAVDVTLNAGTVTHTIQSDRNGGDGWDADARVWIEATNVTVAVGASIDVSERGFQGASPPDSGNAAYGPGRGIRQGGGGYGGRGAIVTNWGGSVRGPIYGDPWTPIDPGSGGGRNANSPSFDRGGHGGGAIYIDASGALNIDGGLYADGQKGGNRGAGGSGGGIYVAAASLAGVGVLSATGGDFSSGTYNASGGGGRISVQAISSTFSGSASVLPGADGTQAAIIQPEAGTFFQQVGAPSLGALDTTLDGNPAMDTALSVTANPEGVVFDRVIDSWTAELMQWTDDSRDTTGASLANLATYTLTGLIPDFRFYSVKVDGVNISGGHITSSSTGTIPAFDVNLAGAQTIVVQTPEPASAALLALGGLAMLRRRR